MEFHCLLLILLLLESLSLCKARIGTTAVWIWKEPLLCSNSRIWDTSEKEVKMTSFFHKFCHGKVSAFSITLMVCVSNPPWSPHGHSNPLLWGLAKLNEGHLNQSRLLLLYEANLTFSRWLRGAGSKLIRLPALQPAWLPLMPSGQKPILGEGSEAHEAIRLCEGEMCCCCCCCW